MILMNVSGTSALTCNCGTWLQHWKNFSGQVEPLYCPVALCMNTYLVGAHVMFVSGYDERWFIVPLCREHNSHTGFLRVSDNINLVLANRFLTCGA